MINKEEIVTLNIDADTLESLLSGSTPGLPDPIQYQYYKSLTNRKILINNKIDSTIVETAILPLLEMDSDKTGKPIEILLNTVGGSLFDGMALCDVIDNLKTPTIITCMTYAYSMGSIILMAGANNPVVKKRCYKHSTALVHAGNSYLEGGAMQVKDQFNFYQDYEKLIKEYTLSHTKISEEEYDRMERYEWYMASDVMLAKGLVDEII